MREQDFWKRYEEDAGWDFLIYEGTSYGLTPYDYLHGHCTAFAQVLHDVFGYPIELVCQRTGDEPDDPVILIHAYCVTEEGYADVRGVCPDYDKFMAEFYDSGLWDNDDYSFTMENLDSIPEELLGNKQEMDKAIPGAENIIKFYGYWNDLSKAEDRTR